MHLFNHCKLHTTRLSYSAPAWFPVPKLRYAEPVFIIAGATASIATELFISPRRHQPLDPDMTIPSNHLHTFEHSSISLALLLHGAFSIAIDRLKSPNPNPNPNNQLSFFVASVRLAQELFLFRLHSTDHTGPEGQYHLFLQLVIAVSLVTMLMGSVSPGASWSGS